MERRALGVTGRMDGRSRARPRWTAPLGRGLLGAALCLALATPAGAEPAPSDDVTEAIRVPRVPRHWRDLSLRLPTERFTAIGTDPGDPEVLLAGTDGFLFKSDDGGESWRPVLSFPRGLAVLDVGTLEDDTYLDDPDDIGAGTARRAARQAEALLDEADQLLDDADAQAEAIEDGDTDVIVDPDALEAAAEELQAQAELVDMPLGDADPLLLPFPRQGPGVREIVFVAPGQRTVYVATARGLFRSVSSGERFTRLELPGGVFANDVRDVAIDPLRPSRLYLGTAAGLLVTRDGGATFERVPGRLGYTPVLALEVAAVEGDTMVVVGTERGLFRSRDGATTFREMMLKGLSPFEPILALAYDARDDITYAGTGQGLFVGERKSALLEAREPFDGLMVLSLSVDPLRPRGIAVGLEGRGVVQSEDTGITAVELGDSLPANDASALTRPADDPDALLVASERGVFGYARGTGIQVSLDRMRALERRWSREPTLAEAGIAALDYAHLSRFAWTSMELRARIAAYAPRLRAEYRYVNGRPNQLQYVVLTDDPDALDFDDLEDLEELYRDGGAELLPATGQVHELFVWASWDLDQLFASPWEVGLARLKPQLVSSEQRVIGRVRSLYTARRRLEAQLYLEQDRLDGRAYAARLLRLAELTSQLDALTGGFFSRTALARGADLAEAELLAPGSPPP